LSLFILSPVRGSMMNNNGFWIGWLDLLTPSCTITLNYNQLQQLKINDCLRLAPFLTGLWVSSFNSFFYCDWLGYDLQIHHFFSFHCPLINTPQLNTQPNSTTELPSEFSSDCIMTDSISYVSYLYNLGTNWIEITISNSSHYCVLLLFCGNLSGDPLPNYGCPSTVDSITWGTCLLNRCLAIDVSAVLLWLYTSGVQASCPNTVRTGRNSVPYLMMCSMYLSLVEKMLVLCSWIWCLKLVICCSTSDLSRYSSWICQWYPLSLVLIEWPPLSSVDQSVTLNVEATCPSETFVDFELHNVIL
jgi:hypothetical protein